MHQTVCTNIGPQRSLKVLTALQVHFGFWILLLLLSFPFARTLPALADLLRWGLVRDAFNRFAHRAELERPHPGISTAVEKDFSGEERGFPSRAWRISLNPKRVCGTDPEGKSFLDWKYIVLSWYILLLRTGYIYSMQERDRTKIIFHNCDSSGSQNCETESWSNHFGIVIYWKND